MIKIEDAVKSLGALAQDTRLALFRRLVEAGPEGLSAGALGEAFGVPGATLSFHLKTLEQGGLVRAHRAGRHIFYAVRLEGMRALMDFLTRDCCAGRPELCGFSPAAGALGGEGECDDCEEAC